jgi:hypothetical protein
MRKVYELRAELECDLLRNGKTIQVLRQNCESFTKWFKRFVGDVFTGAGYRGFSRLDVKDVNGKLSTPGYNQYLYYHYIVKGMAIGTSNTPFDPEQYELQAKLMDATGLTKSIDLQDYDTSVKFELTGTFNINVETDINETGLYGTYRDEGGTDHVFLVSRDVLTTPIHVVPGDVLIVRYRITIS